MKKFLKKQHTFIIALFLCLFCTPLFSRTLEEMLSTVAQQVFVIAQNKGTDPEVSKQRTAARKEINSVLSELKKDKELNRDATLLGTHVRKLTALAVKNTDTQNIEKDITQNLQIIAQKKINSLEKQITEVVGQEETTRSTQIRAMLNNMRTRAYNAVIAPLYPGYHSTPEEKAAAQEMIAQLESQKNLLNADLQNSNLTKMQKNDLIMQITHIDNEIKQQKIITGQEWTKMRKNIVRGAGVLGATGLAGLGYYTYRQKRMQPQVQSQPIQSPIQIQNQINAIQTRIDELTKKESVQKKAIESITERIEGPAKSEKQREIWKQNAKTITERLEKTKAELNQKNLELKQKKKELQTLQVP